MRTRFVQDAGSYCFYILVSVGAKNLKELQKDVHKYVNDYTLKGDYSFNEIDGQYCQEDIVLWLRDYENNDYWNDVLRHEVIHCVQFGFERRGMLNEYEAFAYQVDYLISEIRKKLNKNNGIIKE